MADSKVIGDTGKRWEGNKESASKTLHQRATKPLWAVFILN